MFLAGADEVEALLFLCVEVAVRVVEALAGSGAGVEEAGGVDVVGRLGALVGAEEGGADGAVAALGPTAYEDP